MRIPLPLRSFNDVVPDSSQQRVVNFYPVPTDDKDRVALQGTPGLTSVLTTDDIRGWIYLGGVLYVLAGVTFYSVSSSYVATAIGVVTGTDRAILAASSGQIGIAADGKGFMYTLSTGVFGEITDPDFPSTVTSVTWQDGYFLWSAEDGQFVYSDVTDGTDYDALDFGSAEANPDGIVRTFSDHQQVAMLGQETVEFFRNTGTSSPWRRANELALEIGLIGKHAVTKFDNSIAWVDNHRRVVTLPGVSYQVISGARVAKALKACAAPTDIIATTIVLDGYEILVLYIPGQGTWAYPVTSGQWVEMSSYGNDGWMVRTVIEAYDKILGFGGAKIYEISPSVYSDDGEEIRREVILPYVHADTREVYVNRLEVGLKRGAGLVTGQGQNPIVFMSYSKDGGRNYSAELSRSAGVLGAYKQRAYWNRLGSAETFLFKFRFSDPVDWQITGAFIEADIGN